MGRVIAVFNQAGGVGKTTVAQNLGYTLANRGHKILLIDMDPQASLTAFMGINTRMLNLSVYNSLIAEAEDELPIALPIIKDLYSIDLCPANLNLAKAEQQLVLEELRELRLKDAIAPFLEVYDFILIDCPPSLGILSVISLVAATHVLVPIQTQFKALMGTDLLLGTTKKIQKKLNRNLKLAGFLPTMYSSSTAMDQQTLFDIKEQLAAIAQVFSPLPRATALSEATKALKPFGAFIGNNKKGSNGTILKIFDEIAAAMEKL
ncbi:ParA family protein [Tumidithrix elongata RA019]|uniref:ParA family protein n=1 Tax=Tumidithrix elongata BACA0141 TaxID=2716417 RepID=A0AAW9Q6G3_9CYAN|nr:ParA family protein [Tumidithrix elongata RA019]